VERRSSKYFAGETAFHQIVGVSRNVGAVAFRQMPCQISWLRKHRSATDTRTRVASVTYAVQMKTPDGQTLSGSFYRLYCRLDRIYHNMFHFYSLVWLLLALYLMKPNEFGVYQMELSQGALSALFCFVCTLMIF